MTFHLADSLPRAALARIEQVVAAMAEEERNRERRKRLQALMDAGHGRCVLGVPEIGTMTEAALLHFHGSRYQLHAWVVMPNHVHVLFEPLNGWPLAKIVASWKKYTATRIAGNANLRIRNAAGDADTEIGVPRGDADTEIGVPRGDADTEIGVPGAVWHREYWDRFIRDGRHYRQAVEYIHLNPVQAGLVKQPEDWPWSSASWEMRFSWRVPGESQSGDWRFQRGHP